MKKEVAFEAFDKLHAIRKLRQIVAKWWKVQIHFTDASGFIRGVPKGKFFNPQNPVCIAITAEQKGYLGCIRSVRSIAAASSKAEKARLGRCHSGFSTLALPITLDGNYLGCVFADGFILAETAEEQKALIRAYLQGHFPHQDDLSSMIEKIAVLSARDVEYLTELIEMLIEEILHTERDLSIAKEEVKALKSELTQRYQFAAMVGKSAAMQNLYRLLERIAPSDALVLIRGENGVGKELIAKALHYNSPRGAKKFIAVNCAAFNENLLESELFGHVKGAFTGAIKDKDGLFAAVGAGTLFLDEIGDISLNMQVKLLRVLQDASFIPVGGVETHTSQARIVCATNKDLEAMVQAGTFREDLYYRLQVIQLKVPPLRERKEDIPLLIAHFLEKKAEKNQTTIKKISPDCMSVLLDYSWPGNIRELENELERLVVLSGTDENIAKDLLSERILAGTLKQQELKLARFKATGHSLKDATEALEREIIEEGLKRCGGNKSRLAKELGISRAGLLLKLEKMKLT